MNAVQRMEKYYSRLAHEGITAMIFLAELQRLKDASLLSPEEQIKVAGIATRERTGDPSQARHDLASLQNHPAFHCIASLLQSG